MANAENFTVAPKTELEPWAEEMLDEQEKAPPQQEQQAQDPAASDVILFQVPSLSANDADGLARILAEHPDLHEQILSTAASFLGNDIVVRALEIRKGAAKEPAPAAVEPKPELTPPAVVAEQAAEATTKGKAETAAAPAVEQVKEPVEEKPVEPGWVVRARAFNARHEDDVRLFNIATGFACEGPDRQPDPNAVANWQAQHGVDPDGRIGKETADRAWQLMPVEAPKAAPEVAAEPPA